MEVSKEIDVMGEKLSVRTVDCQTETAPQKVVLSAAAQTAVVVEGVLEICDMLTTDQLKKLSASVQRLLAQRLNTEKKVEQVIQTAGPDMEPPTPSSSPVADFEVLPPPFGFEDAPSEPISVAENSSPSENSSSSSDVEKPLISSPKKKNRKKKKKSPEVLTQCTGPVDSFSDDLIDTTPTKSMAVTVEKLQQAKKNPDKVIGKRKWTQGKGTIKEKSFSETLADGLNVKPTVFIYQPPAVQLQAKSKVKCPWTNFPSQTWLKLVEKHNITVNTEQSVLDSMLVNYIKKGFHFNMNLWKKAHGNRLKNPYLTDLQGLLNAVNKNVVRERYVSYALWLKEMRAYSAVKVKPNWYKNE
ncbi:MAG: hypothetical protein [Apis nora virus 2]|nr:MAG: hypothetical protein [Apis nora virus 2]